MPFHSLTLCTLTKPIILTPRCSNSSFSFANAPSSVVHTGVKSAGWEKRIVQLLPTKSWKLMSPCVVVALKLGAGFQVRVCTTQILRCNLPSDPSLNRGCSAGVAKKRRKGVARAGWKAAQVGLIGRKDLMNARGAARGAKEAIPEVSGVLESCCCFAIE